MKSRETLKVPLKIPRFLSAITSSKGEEAVSPAKTRGVSCEFLD